jgi:hypothetical protein
MGMLCVIFGGAGSGIPVIVMMNDVDGIVLKDVNLVKR